MTATTTKAEEMLEAARNGDRHALEELLHAHRYGVYRYGLRVCRTTEDAEDAVQETLWAATRALDSFRGPASSVARWMFTIVRRVCMRLIEGHRRWPENLEGTEDAFPADAAGPDIAYARQQRAVKLAAALQTLDRLSREVIILRDVKELSAPEAAARLGVSVGALKSRLHRARAKLREHLGSEPSEASGMALGPEAGRASGQLA
jgi:RNA polymerase sigma factor (sigma-70 family)